MSLIASLHIDGWVPPRMRGGFNGSVCLGLLKYMAFFLLRNMRGFNAGLVYIKGL